ncbi:MAG TPA: DUF167 domain-containing protein [Dehalococcoidia bacterium]|nr:DUF167 domain-containing protein [Dehalococcoidia bacterium]
MAYLKVRVTPAARQDALAGWAGEVLLVRVRAAPERGKANDAACRLLARELGLAAGEVTLARGAASRYKLLRVDGLSDEEIRRKLGA